MFDIHPDINIHDITTIDPGLIQINRDYGFMRAADVMGEVAPDGRRWRTATEMAALRRDTWALENRRAGQPDPTRRGQRAPPPDPTLQGAIDQNKSHLVALIAERRSLGGPIEPFRFTVKGAQENHA